MQKRRWSASGILAGGMPSHWRARGSSFHARTSHTAARPQRLLQPPHCHEPSAVISVLLASGQPPPHVRSSAAAVTRGRHGPQMTLQRPMEHQPSSEPSGS
jgi:hypothetical protein